MKKIACTALASLMLLSTNAFTGLAQDTFYANGIYYPYQTYDQYHREITSPEPPPSQPPAPQPQPPKEVKPQRPEQPITLTQPPEFLFPAELGFGVAVGVPYDMFYLSDNFYFLKSGTWYRSASYRGPWMLQGFSRVPPELRKHKIARIRELRNREFADFWKNRDHYQGRYFRPDDEPGTPAPLKKGP
ncbi:MAG: hypothetical protein A2075_18395 [Geobacteraceae bacterium GWC2_58_44]|nr:MAG: hypothetical protein A2075_18395 [Geobacteraceae bacterium GWC2_58_44]HBG05638.1 hypothetical protein [Geobacter sp.]